MMDKKIFVKAYYAKNLGDDLFIKILCNRYPNTKFYLDSFRYRFMRKYCNNIFVPSILSHAIDKIKIIFRKIKTLSSVKAIRRSDAMVVIGGSMFIEQEGRGVYDDIYDCYFQVAKRFFILGMNFGPYKTIKYLDSHKKLFQRAEDICVRDEHSYLTLGGQNENNIRISPDIIFGIRSDRGNIQHENSSKTIVISVINCEHRFSREIQKRYEDSICRVATDGIAEGFKIVLMSFCTAEGDEDAVNRIADKIESESVDKYYYHGDINEALDIIYNCEALVGTRFHACVIGLAFHKPIIPIAYSDKTINMLKDCGYQGRIFDLRDAHGMDIEISDAAKLSPKTLDEMARKSEKHFTALDTFLNRSSLNE